MRCASLRTASLAAVIAAMAMMVASCGSDREVTVPRVDAIPAPTFQALPGDLADSPQLDALALRDTAGVDVDAPSASTELLDPALAALASLDPAPASLIRLSIGDGDVSFDFPDDGVLGRSITMLYRGADDPPYLGTPSFTEDDTYPLASVDPTVPARLVEAIQRRFPTVRVTRFDLSISQSRAFGLVWNLSIDDGRGRFATIFADLDGAIIAVDLD